MIAGILGAWIAPVVASGAGATTSTTLPGPAPNQSQINSTESQVSQIEATLAQEEQQTSILDEKYDTAEQNAEDAQNALASLNATMVRTESAVDVDKRLVANDAVEAYIYGTPESGYAAYFNSSASDQQARTQYTNQIVGDLQKDENGLQRSESKLQTEEVQQQQVAAQAQAEAAQTKTLAAANEQEAATTQATLNQIQGQLAQEVAQAAIEEAQEEAAAAAAAASAAAQTAGRRRRGHGGHRGRRRGRVDGRRGGHRRGQSGRRSRGLPRTDRRHLPGRLGADGRRPGRRLPVGHALRLRRGGAGRRIRLLGTGAVGLGAGGRLHPADDRDGVAGAPARVTRRSRAG